LGVHGYADLLYTWTDAKGVTHITQDPPPDTAKGIDTFYYSPQPNQPIRPSTANDQPNQEQGNPNQGSEQTGSSVGTGDAYGDSGNTTTEFGYSSDSYGRSLRQYEKRGARLDNGPGKVGDRPGRF
jgi:hypothetical protein